MWKSRALVQEMLASHAVVIGRVAVETTHYGMGLPPEINAVIQKFLDNNPMAQWAKDNSINGVYVNELPREQIDHIYELMVDLKDKDCTYWRLVNG